MLPVKILVVCQFYYPEHFSITDVARGFVEAGHEVLVVTGKPNYGYGRILDGYQDVTDEVIHGVRVHRCKLYPRKKSKLSICRNYLSFWRNSKRYLHHLKEEFDVVYSMSLSPLISIVGGTIYARKHHVRHVLHCLDLWPESPVATKAIHEGSLPYRLLHHWSRKIYSGLDRILISSPSFERYFRENLHVNNVPIEYVPQPPMLGTATETVNYSHKVNIVYAGNIGTLQLVEDFVKAVALVKDKIDIGFAIIGMGTRVDALRQLISSLKLEDHVSFHGIKTRDATAGYYLNATGIVVSLADKGWVGKTIPGKLNGALSYGRPILGCLSGDGKAILEETGGAVIAESESVEDIAKAILELGEKSESELAEMGKRNREYFEKNFATKCVVDKILNQII